MNQQRQASAAFTQRLIDVIPDPVFIKKAGGHPVMIKQAFANSGRNRIELSAAAESN